MGTELAIASLIIGFGSSQQAQQQARSAASEQKEASKKQTAMDHYDPICSASFVIFLLWSCHRWTDGIPI